VVVLTGVGEKAFCTGADVTWQRAGKMGRTGAATFTPPYQTLVRCPKHDHRAHQRLRHRRRHHFAYFCDFTISADHAVFGQSEPRVAYPASGPVVNYLTRIVGHKRAREMWMLGRPLPRGFRCSIGDWSTPSSRWLNLTPKSPAGVTNCSPCRQPA